MDDSFTRLFGRTASFRRNPCERKESIIEMLEERAAVSTVATVLLIVVCLVLAAVGGAYIIFSSSGQNSSNSMIPSSLSSTTIASTAIATSGTACANVASYDESIPSTYQSMYTTLDQILNEFGQNLDSTAPVATHQTIYATELLPADSNIGPKLLSQQTLQSVTEFLDAIQKLGVQGVTIDISYPILTPSFPNYDQYLGFYQNVVEQVRQRRDEDRHRIGDSIIGGLSRDSQSALSAMQTCRTVRT